MRKTYGGRQGMATLAAALIGLTACSGPTAAVKSGGEAQPAAKSTLQNAVEHLLANKADGKLGNLAGAGFLSAPIAVPVADSEVSLLPNLPELEAALTTFQRRWREGRRQPRPFKEAQAAFALLTAQRVAVGRLGGEPLVQFAKTDDRGRFRFERVPAGEWLLVGSLSSPVSILLWAVPVEVAPGANNQVFLLEGNVLLEATTDGGKLP